MAVRFLGTRSRFLCLRFCQPYYPSCFYSKTNWMHQCLKFILFGVTLYMFRTVFPSIIRSSRLYILQQAYVKQILLSLHVSDGLSVHHQEFKTAHTATGVCQTDTAVSTCFGRSFRPSSGVQDCSTYSNQILLSAC